jgi:ABC-type dipeptide/oligopeptide/nickel transport system permease component
VALLPLIVAIDRYFGIYFEVIMDTVIVIVILFAVCFFLGFLSYRIYESKMDGVYKAILLVFLSLFCFPVAIYNIIIVGRNLGGKLH